MRSCRSSPLVLACTLAFLYALTAVTGAVARGQAPTVAFSFRYDGKPSASLLHGWQRSTRPVSPRAPAFTRTVYVDHKGRLQVTIEQRGLSDFPDAVEYLLYFRNIGTKDSGMLENILPLDLHMPAQPGPAFVHHARGSSATAADFAPLDEPLTPGGNVHLASNDGRPSSGASLPFFNVESAGQGVIAAVGWTGNWAADIGEDRGSDDVHIAAGMPHTHLRLHPGEEVRTPRIVLLRWAANADGWQGAQNRWRQLLLAHYTPQQDGQPLRGPITFGDSGSVPLTTHLGAVHWVQQHNIAATLYAVDAGWYGYSLAGDDTLEHSWWGNRGNWFPSPRYDPDGLRPLGDAAAAAGFGFSLWIEPETAMPDSQLVHDHPEWFLRVDDNHAGAVLFDLGNTAARAYMTDLLSGLITRFGMTWLRLDFNTPPAAFWKRADAPDRVGMSEVQHIEGLYAMLDDLLARHPGLRIDNCASGGRRLDLEMMSRSFVVWRTDYGYADTDAVQAQTQALAPWVPETSGTEAASLAGPWLRPGPYSTARSRYLLRLAYSAGLTIGTGAGTDNPAFTNYVQDEIAEFREVQPYLYGDFYALAPYTLSDTAWTAWQFDRPAQGDGIVIVLRRPKSDLASMPLHLRHIDLDATYEVELRRTYEHAAVQRMSGRSLAELTVELPDAPDSALVLYREVQ